MKKHRSAPKPDMLTVKERDTCAKMRPNLPNRNKNKAETPTTSRTTQRTQPEHAQPVRGNLQTGRTSIATDSENFRNQWGKSKNGKTGPNFQENSQSGKSVMRARVLSLPCKQNRFLNQTNEQMHPGRSATQGRGYQQKDRTTNTSHSNRRIEKGNVTYARDNTHRKTYEMRYNMHVHT